MWATRAAPVRQAALLSLSRAKVQGLGAAWESRGEVDLRLGRTAEHHVGTQAEIGQRIGLSQIQVSRIIRQALRRLQAMPDTQDSQTMAA